MEFCGERRVVVYNVGHGIDSLVPHKVVGSLYGLLSLLVAETVALCRHLRSKSTLSAPFVNSTAHIGEFEVGVSVDKTCADDARIELYAGRHIELLVVLLDSQYTA
jgi:hypothetical protein